MTEGDETIFGCEGLSLYTGCTESAEEKEGAKDRFHRLRVDRLLLGLKGIEGYVGVLQDVITGVRGL
jgi:hypothetical protein